MLNIKGDHGTSKEAWKSIEISQFNLSYGDDLWLGDGVYFFEDNKAMAQEWAKAHLYSKAKEEWREVKNGGYTGTLKEYIKSENCKERFNQYTVINCNVDAKEEYCLDLEQEENAELFHGYRETLVERIKKAKFSVRGRRDKQERKVLDGQVINELVNLSQEHFNKEYKIVKAKMFVKKVGDRMLNVDSRISNCTVVAVRDPECISNPTLTEEGDCFE